MNKMDFVFSIPSQDNNAIFSYAHEKKLQELQAPKLVDKICKEKQNKNHGGSPPNLGLKETTPAPGETRHKRLHASHPHFMHFHNNMEKFATIDYNNTPSQGFTQRFNK